MKIANAIRAILKVDGWNQSKLATHLNVTQPTVSRWLKGSDPNGAQYSAIQDLYKEVVGGVKEVANATPIIGLPHLDIHAGLGNGGLGYVEVDPDTMRPKPEYTTGDWLFPSDVGARIGVLKGKYAFPVEGDSMSPTLEGGSIVFVDTQRAYPSPPGLFVVDTGDGRLVKRVELIPRSEQIRIISDNKDYGTYEFHRDEVNIFGRVIAVFSWNE